MGKFESINKDVPTKRAGMNINNYSEEKNERNETEANFGTDEELLLNNFEVKNVELWTERDSFNYFSD